LEPPSGGVEEAVVGPGEKRRYLLNSATKARERFHRQESGHVQGGAPSGFGGRPNMDEDEEDYGSSSGSDRVSTGRGIGCKSLFFSYAR